MEKIENLKKLHCQISDKDAFAQTIADYFGLKKVYVKQYYLQSKWKIPKERIDKCIEIAQNTIRSQIEVLKDTLKTA